MEREQETIVYVVIPNEEPGITSQTQLQTCYSRQKYLEEIGIPDKRTDLCAHSCATVKKSTTFTGIQMFLKASLRTFFKAKNRYTDSNCILICI